MAPILRKWNHDICNNTVLPAYLWMWSLVHQGYGNDPLGDLKFKAGRNWRGLHSNEFDFVIPPLVESSANYIVSSRSECWQWHMFGPKNNSEGMKQDISGLSKEPLFMHPKTQWILETPLPMTNVAFRLVGVYLAWMNNFLEASISTSQSLYSSWGHSHRGFKHEPPPAGVQSLLCAFTFDYIIGNSCA